MNNPFTMSFGKEPRMNLSRLSQTGVILEAFDQEPPSQQTYIITGVRGAGKTVSLTMISKRYEEREDWIVLELNPSSDLMKGMAAKLYNTAKLRSLISSVEFNFSMLGFGAAVTSGTEITDMEMAIEEMIKKVRSKNKRVLLVIDEVTNSPSMREFANAFQIFIRKDYPLYLVMTGLYENIYNLQNNKALTFLYRAPKIALNFLSISAVANAYAGVFHLKEEESAAMARMTKGYPFAFQALGYLRWENPDLSLEKLIPQYMQYLEEFVYEKIWSELPGREKEILLTVAEGSTKIGDIREKLKMSSSEMSVYRKRLDRRGLVETGAYGLMSLRLPFFGEIIKMIGY